MRNLFLRLVCCLMLVGASLAQNESELETLDRLRTSGEAVVVKTRIEVYEQGELMNRSLMNVYVGQNRKSLAVYLSEREAGQKVLMIDDNFWLFLPSSKRAMRITAMQKLMGEASVGDVASLSWAEDYDVVARIEQDEQIQLSLVAARKGLSYSKVTLWVGRENHHPIKADFYLKSGKLAKQATFELMQAQGQWRVVALSLQDRVQKDQLTKIIYEQITPVILQDAWFTPQYLLRAAP